MAAYESGLEVARPVGGHSMTEGVVWVSPADCRSSPRMSCLVELGGLEPPTPCLQSDVYVRPGGADLASRLSVSSRGLPLPTPVNGTLMARRSCWAGDLGHLSARSLRAPR